MEVAENWDGGLPLVVERDSWEAGVKQAFDVSLMEEVENLEYRVYHSSLQVKVSEHFHVRFVAFISCYLLDVQFFALDVCRF